MTTEFLRTLLTMSISGSIVALILIILKYLLKNVLSQTSRYYLWLIPIVIWLTLVPIKLPTLPTPIDTNFIPNVRSVIDEYVVTTHELIEREYERGAERSTDVVMNAKGNSPFTIWLYTAIIIWPAGVLLSMVLNITGYLRFIRRIQSAEYEMELPNCPEKVYKSWLAFTPMLVGVIRPRIYLPDIKYTDEQLDNILLHELTHLRRRDIWLKWLVMIVVSVHWFNPVVYFMRREFNRSCELSCDEAVIRRLDSKAKQSYGDTLISVVAKNRHPAGVTSATMCEEKKNLKERLVAIMNYKKKTKITVLITVVLAVVISGSALAFGVSIAPNNQNILKMPDGWIGNFDGKEITLDNLRLLSAKGDNLVFEDFNEYNGEDVGSGLYILHFTVEGGYSLLVGGGSVTGKPMYVRLSVPGIEEYIDIRYDDIDEFISKYHIPNELAAQINVYLNTIMSSPAYSSSPGDYIKAHQTEYDAILDMGVTAFPTLTGILNNGDKGLRGNIAALAVRNIVERERAAEKHLSEWRDGVIQSALSDVERWSRDFFPPNNSTLTARDEKQSESLPMLTLDDIRALSQLDNELSISNFIGYENKSSTAGVSKGQYWRFPIAGGKWELEVNADASDDSEPLTACYLIPSGFEFRPQNMINIRDCDDGDVSEYISYVESYDGTQTQLTDSEEAAALAAAFDYETRIFGGKVSDITRIADPAEYAGAIIVNKIKGKIAGFYVTINNGNPPRSIVLTQSDDGIWEVINEGY